MIFPTSRRPCLHPMRLRLLAQRIKAREIHAEKPVRAASAARSDAIAGLTVLGYSMPEINAALRKLPSIEGMSADLIIKAALRAMMQQ